MTDHAIGDDAALAGLRLAALGLADGSDWSRCDDHELVRLLGHHRHAAAPDAAAPALYPLSAPRMAAAASPPPAASSAPARVAAAAEAPVLPSTSAFSVDVDVPAMVQALAAAARDGIPFCEECERARQARRAA